MIEGLPTRIPGLVDIRARQFALKTIERDGLTGWIRSLAGQDTSALDQLPICSAWTAG